MNRKIIGIYNFYGMNLKNNVEKTVSKLQADFTHLNIQVQNSEGEAATYFGVNRFPTFLFIKNDAILLQVTGKYMYDHYFNQVMNLGWNNE